MSKRSKCCIIGIPDQQGIIHVGGRIGAAQGPTAFRKLFSRMQGRFPFQGYVEDLGNIQNLGTDVAQNHIQVADFISKVQSPSTMTIVVGGGHDHGYSHLLGVSQSFKQNLKMKKRSFRLGCINIDAHLDVRKPAPLITSGSPFYLALESGILEPKNFIEFGIQSHCNAPYLWEYIKKKKATVVPFEKIRNGRAIPEFRKCLKKLSSTCDTVVISFDLDALPSAYSPGVSAPQAEGFTAMEIIEMMEIAGKESKVSSLGIFELNPEHDIGDASARLAATAAHHFIQAALFF